MIIDIQLQNLFCINLPKNGLFYIIRYNNNKLFNFIHYGLELWVLFLACLFHY